MSLDYSAVKDAAPWALVAVAAVGVVVAIVIRKIVGKILTLVLAAALVFFGWQQRDRVMDWAGSTASGVRSGACASQPSFFGVDVSFPGC
ncbi:hypothetical protein [Nakamurella endophytica]|uniref:Uncharacterized protein n=1 Tax=Nakamurella endophytica TaxID=1748367 RepID=A0A917WJE9_9ACTN|nr:hypothetical protein [Nakamurella endophytica]GGM08404.1 hypothetical protein GCM10011594_30460 [Nakamurella endophytica]